MPEKGPGVVGEGGGVFEMGLCATPAPWSNFLPPQLEHEVHKGENVFTGRQVALAGCWAWKHPWAVVGHAFSICTPVFLVRKPVGDVLGQT